MTNPNQPGSGPQQPPQGADPTVYNPAPGPHQAPPMYGPGNQPFPGPQPGNPTHGPQGQPQYGAPTQQAQPGYPQPGGPYPPQGYQPPQGHQAPQGYQPPQQPQPGDPQQPPGQAPGSGPDATVAGGYPPAPAHPGQPFPGGAYPPPGEPAGSGPDSGGRSRVNKIVYALAALLVLGAAAVLITAFWQPGWAPKNLSGSAAADGVTRVLTDDYGLSDVSDVSCPDGERVEQGASFTCSLQLSGQAQQVTVTFVDDDGTYEVSRPS